MIQVFNKSAKTTHNLDISDLIGKQFAYQCLCTTHQLTIRRHNKVLKGASYLCRKCKAPLQVSA